MNQFTKVSDKLKKNKYHAMIVFDADGERFDSKKELNRWHELRRMEIDGEIQNLRRQVTYQLGLKHGRHRGTRYIADFVYEKDGKTIVEDVKGYRQGAAYSVFRVKADWMYEKYGIEVLET